MPKDKGEVREYKEKCIFSNLSKSYSFDYYVIA